MSINKYLVLGIGVLTGIGISLAGLSYASYNSSRIITTQKAQDIMLGKVPGSTLTEFSYDGDDIVPKYDGTVIKDNYEYEIDVNAKTGDIIKFEKERIYNNSSSNNTTVDNNQTTTKPSTSTNNSTANNEVTTKPNTSTSNSSSSNNEATVKPSTSTNTSSSNNNQVAKPSTSASSSNSGNSLIGESKAKSIMLGKVPGATFRTFYLDYDDGRAEYEAELVKGNYEYEITVDANTGSIREFNKDYIEKYDDDKYDNDYDDDDRYDD